MNKLTITLAFALLGGVTSLHAQTPDPKTEWATKVVALQQGPELDRLVSQLTASTTQEVIANWGPKLRTNVPQAKQQKAMEDLNVELKKYAEDTNKLIGKQVKKVSADVLIPAYAERFSVDELKEIAAFFDSPAIKKYQAAAPELGNTFVKKLIEASRSDVIARAKQFDDAALKIVGNTPAEPKASKPAKK